MHQTATLTKWYDERGRHEIYAGGKSVNLESTEHNLMVRQEIITNEVQHDLDKLGIAKTAREEKRRMRDKKLKEDAERDAQMAKLYREVVLGEKSEPLVQIGGLSSAPAAKPAAEEREEVGSFGD